MEAASYRRQPLSLGRIHLEQWQLPDFTHYFSKFAEFSISQLGTKTLRTQRHVGELTSSSEILFQMLTEQILLVYLLYFLHVNTSWRAFVEIRQRFVSVEPLKFLCAFGVNHVGDEIMNLNIKFWINYYGFFPV